MTGPLAGFPLVKICGLTRNEDARWAESSGADFVGVVLSDGFGRSVPRQAAAAVVEGTSLARVAVLVDESPASTADLAACIDASVLQLHGDEGRETIAALRGLGEWTIWKAVRGRTLGHIRSVVEAVGDVVDGILVEGWRDGVTGGGGVPLALDAEEVRRAVPEDLTFVLAGGLEPGSVHEAVARFRPDVVDVSSGVERALGLKSATKVERFVRAARTVPDRS